jgi:hypothetical protein
MSEVVLSYKYAPDRGKGPLLELDGEAKLLLGVEEEELCLAMFEFFHLLDQDMGEPLEGEGGGKWVSLSIPKANLRSHILVFCPFNSNYAMLNEDTIDRPTYVGGIFKSELLGSMPDQGSVINIMKDGII